MKGNEITTFEEAVKFIKDKIQIDVRFCTEEEVKTTIRALELACKSLEKQIPKKPVKKNPNCYYKSKDGEERYAYDHHCPICDAKLKANEHHCPCGQALDWSETE